MVESEIGARRHPVACPPAEQISGPDTLAGAGPRKLLGRFGSVKGPGWRPAGWAALPLALASAWLVVGCSDRERSAPTARTPQATPALRLVAFTDLAGALEPCGCQSRPLGGMDRAASMLDQLRADKTPVLLVAAGDVFFGNPPEGAVAGADATTQEIWKAETLVDVLGKLGLAAAAPGTRDLSYGREVFDKLAARAKFRLLAAPKAASWLTTVGSTKVGLFGVSANDAPDVGRLQGEVKSLRDAGAQVMIALFSTDQRSGRRLAGALTGVDFVVQGGLAEESAPPPSRAGQATILRASRDGRGLVVADLYPRAGSSFEDISDWSRREQSAALSSRIKELDGKIRGWESDPHVDRASLDQQRAKLLELRAEEKTLLSPRTPSAAAFDARFVELGPEVAKQAEIRALMDAHDARLNDHNRVAFASVRAPAAERGMAHYVGSDGCKSCHGAAYTWWQKNEHGHAYTTLETRHKQFNLSCVGCHVTGYNKPGGAAVVQNEGLTHVGCESCHGPGSVHAEQPDTEPAPFITRSPQAAVCKECHTPEHSDKFEYNTYVGRLRAPGHGM
ncbi:MAG TPA: multiheme c-type cytochrome [Polyangiales bacterium]|nr:multiheme c-type cytochrome [Polyangiales bacterium]